MNEPFYETTNMMMSNTKTGNTSFGGHDNIKWYMDYMLNNNKDYEIDKADWTAYLEYTKGKNLTRRERNAYREYCKREGEIKINYRPISPKLLDECGLD